MYRETNKKTVRGFFVTALALNSAQLANAKPAEQMHSNYWLLHYQELYFFASVLGGWFHMTANTLNALPPGGFWRLNGRIMGNINSIQAEHLKAI